MEFDDLNELSTFSRDNTENKSAMFSYDIELNVFRLSVKCGDTQEDMDFEFAPDDILGITRFADPF
tara:strand:- start:3924 stop:4121 length:198 start_codon:yes stop_codon:yes gene_type:complete